MIEVTNLVKHYGDKKAVNDISFTINDGELVGFLGPNGAGKSTTMNVLTGYLSATSGSAKINGVDILEDPINAKRHIGYLPEQPPLYMDMTVNEYLDFICDLKGVKDGRKQHIDDMCELTGITHVYKRMIRNLSKGYKQRVGLAQALIGNPEVLILDEPTVGLDPIQIIEIRNVIKDLGKKRTVILSSHILPEVQAICERVLVINHGEIIANDTPANLSRYVDIDRKMQIRVAGSVEKVQPLLARIPEMERVIFEGNIEPETCDFILEPKSQIDIRKTVFNTLANAGCPILMFSPVSASLEDIFIKLTAEQAGK
ncbi:MAG: ATP-binding cassette domain-containing protein [Ruminococcaceae bacterium]|nr:ATP-binding cassette domain-containing protein [Oscillospiraceae bacterium]